MIATDMALRPSRAEWTYPAWTWKQPGDAGSLQRQDRRSTPPAFGEVWVANRAIGLNPVDWKVIQAGHPEWSPGHVPGVDGVGHIVAVGPGVVLPLGMRVAYHQHLARDGSFAHYTRLRADSLLPVPDGISDVQAAALPCPALTAWQALHKVPASNDRDVLITGAGGAVGRVLVQLAAECGWRVWAAAATGHHQALLAHGAAGVFDHHDSRWTQALDDVLGPRRLHAVFDTVSGEHAGLLAQRLGYNGHLVCIQDRQEQAPLPAFTRAISLHEVALNSIHAHATEREWRDWRVAGSALFARLLRGGLSLGEAPRLLSFEDVPQALAALHSGRMKGKAVALLPTPVPQNNEPVSQG
ncbi:zinc-binding dehydrogenase [Pseudomonas oryzihabitans]|uniref:zinc-binding dehydrogenase n=1 Tax=Pseudomonas oryzihabitans TaxID=47885 RepID=UPI0028956610|nr:zinc-binding dehydrogenase [Pseudomonas oryzihabitans]MDT3720680.1 zinc-binding dehydrogenase [Pseudomonas oryzihabitans]